jgi:hypothetical protein
MVTMNDVIAFIEKAMKENLNIQTCTVKYDGVECCYMVYVWNNDEKYINIAITSTGNKFTIQLLKKSLDAVNIETTEMDVALFKVEFLKVQEYSKNKVIEYFNNFFNSDEAKPTTINDLDNEDD